MIEQLPPKIDDALGAVIDFIHLKRRHGKYETDWGHKTALGLKLSIVEKLKEYGVVLTEEKQ